LSKLYFSGFNNIDFFNSFKAAQAITHGASGGKLNEGYDSELFRGAKFSQ